MNLAQTDAGFARPGDSGGHCFTLLCLGVGFHCCLGAVHAHHLYVGSEKAPCKLEGKMRFGIAGCKHRRIQCEWKSGKANVNCFSVCTIDRLTSATQPSRTSFRIDSCRLCGPRSRGVCLYRLTFKIAACSLERRPLWTKSKASCPCRATWLATLMVRVQHWSNNVNCYFHLFNLAEIKSI